MTSEDTLFFKAGSRPYGYSYGHWTVRWWRWCLSTPAKINPVMDMTGEFGHTNQPRKHVWFLAGRIVSGEHDSLPRRHCYLPSGRSILFPVINFEANPLEYVDLATRQDLIERVKIEEDTILKKECLVNGKSIPAQRVRSDPLIFNLTLDEDNLVNAIGGRTFASADGDWVFLKPLPVGHHMLSFEGSCQSGKLKSGANYLLEIE